MKIEDKMKMLGEASVFLELKNGYIKMYHGTDKVLLFSKIAENNKTWDNIIKQIKTGV